MRAKAIVVWALVCVAFVVLAVTVCEVKSCVNSVRQGVARRPGGVSLLPRTIDAEPEPKALPPGKAAGAASTRRPLFGTEKDGGALVEVAMPGGQDTAKLYVRRDFSVVNTGSDTMTVKVTKVGPPLIQWDPGFGAVVVAARGPNPRALINLGKAHLDIGLKGKLIDIPLFGGRAELGIPVVYATTAGVAAGIDLKLDAIENLALDVCYNFYWREELQAGLSVNF